MWLFDLFLRLVVVLALRCLPGPVVVLAIGCDVQLVLRAWFAGVAAALGGVKIRGW